MSMMDMIEEEYQYEIEILKTALAKAVKDSMRICSSVANCGGCDSECYNQQIQDKCDAFIFEAKSEVDKEWEWS